MGRERVRAVTVREAWVRGVMTRLPRFSTRAAVARILLPAAWLPENDRFGRSYRACPKGALNTVRAYPCENGNQTGRLVLQPAGLARLAAGYQTRPK